MSKNSEFVKFDKVDKSYDGKVLVVKDLNLDISEGEFITMLGPSGSGKTTCLMMLAGFETPTNGEIFPSCRKPSGTKSPAVGTKKKHSFFGFVCAGRALLRGGKSALSITDKDVSVITSVSYWLASAPPGSQLGE